MSENETNSKLSIVIPSVIFERQRFGMRTGVDKDTLPDAIYKGKANRSARKNVEIELSKLITANIVSYKNVGNEKIVVLPDTASENIRNNILGKIEKIPRYRHFEYLLSLEDDFRIISKYINIVESNYSRNSIELTSFILKACTQIEILFTRMTNTQNKEIQDKIVHGRWEEYSSFCVDFPLWGIMRSPWEKSPLKWWVGYNEIKHEIDRSDDAGNLENALDSLAALYIATLYYERFMYGTYHPSTKGYITLPASIIPKLLSPASKHIQVEYGKFGERNKMQDLTILWTL